MSENNILDQAARYGIVPVIAIDDAASAIPPRTPLRAAFQSWKSPSAPRGCGGHSQNLTRAPGAAGGRHCPHLTNLEAASQRGPIRRRSRSQPQIIQQPKARAAVRTRRRHTHHTLTGLSLGCKLLVLSFRSPLRCPMLEALPPHKHTGLKFVPGG
jgi:hypothetical protein